MSIYYQRNKEKLLEKVKEYPEKKNKERLIQRLRIRYEELSNEENIKIDHKRRRYQNMSVKINKD